MNDRSVTTQDQSRFLPIMLFLFVGSGCAALIYEVVWFQLLQLVVGSSAISLGVLLGTFMGGMCLGSYLLPRYIDIKHHPLRVYAFLELGIGIFALLLLWGMPLIDTHLPVRHRRLGGDPRHHRGDLPAAADADDGRDAAGRRPLGQDDAAGRGVAGLLLRRQHRRRRARMRSRPGSTCCASTTSASRPTPRSRSTRSSASIGLGLSKSTSYEPNAEKSMAGAKTRRTPASSTSRSRCRASRRSRRRCCGRGSCRSSSAPPSTRSR